ncbi:MAG: cysteine desulfurase family protein [Candidatus Bathyarchaeia archaeon]
MKTIYLDHAATTPIDPRVLSAILPYYESKFGNASSLHWAGREAKEALEKARETVASVLNADRKEIVFTSGGTESDNLAIKGVAYALKGKGRHLITSAIEHPAVLESFKALQEEGFKVSYIPVGRDGIVDVGRLEEEVRPDTILISVMHANNEVGTIQPIEEIGEIAERNGVCLHTDAVQTMGKLPIDVEKLKVSLLSISAHKIYGPKGVGALYVKDGVKIRPILHGGGHEGALRSGTENVPGIVGLSFAAETAVREMDETVRKMRSLRDQLIKGILEQVPGSSLTGHPVKRLPNNAHFCFQGVEGESLILTLNEEGIAASTGSACSSKKKEPSHVLLAMGLDPITAKGSLRLTLGRWNSEPEIDYTVDAVAKAVEKLRRISPITH